MQHDQMGSEVILLAIPRKAGEGVGDRADA